MGPRLDKYSRYASPLFLTAALWDHGKRMAETMERLKVPRPTFQGTDIPDLLAYIRSAGGRDRARVRRAGEAKGRGGALHEKALCRMPLGRGPWRQGAGPDLGLTLKGSLMRIAGSMWNHGPQMWAKMTERGIEVPVLSTQEMSDLISYLYFFQFIDPPGDGRRGLVVYKEKRCGTCHALRGVGEKVEP